MQGAPVAQDKMMLNTAYDMAIVDILRDNLKETTNLRGKRLTKKVMEIYKGQRLDWEAMKQQIEDEAARYTELSGKEVSELQKILRLKELEREKLPLSAEQKAEAEQLARSSIFTDDRGGLLATLANSIGYVSNSSPFLGVVIKPFVPFTKIVGNVAEFMFDFIPFYGFLRGEGGLVRIKEVCRPQRH
jgi:hypothetical protein